MAIRETIHQPIPHVERAIAGPPRPQRARRRRASGRASGIDEGLMGIALLAGPANVIMQLARPGVGYGVMESRVEGGRVDLHPIKRARTTFTYLAVATAGSDAQKEAFRRAVNRAHAQVYSTPDSPVQYNAFDPDLQLWVGACLYKGGVDIYRMFIGELDGEDADRHYREGMALATTLQVPPEMWPADRAAFDRYWQESLAKVRIDDAVRDYLYPIAASRVRGVALPHPLQRLSDSFALLITTGFLPQRFRDEMRLPWDATKQRRFDRLMAVLRTVNRMMPRFVRQFPFNVLLADVDRRIRTGRPLV
ncbi:MAG: oxygenase MpaB family protein [Mycobacterium sp.]